MSGKYHNKRTECDGYSFDSLAECARYQELRLLQKAGEIRALLVHPRYLLQESFREIANSKQHAAIYYAADFEYVEVATGRRIVEDVKGCETAVWRLKRKLFLYRYWHSLHLVVKPVERKRQPSAVLRGKGEA